MAQSKAARDKEIEELWFKFLATPTLTNGNGDRYIANGILSFGASAKFEEGTLVDGIYSWFGINHSKGLSYLEGLKNNRKEYYSLMDMNNGGYIKDYTNFGSYEEAYEKAWDYWESTQTEFDDCEIRILRKEKENWLNFNGIKIDIHFDKLKEGKKPKLKLSDYIFPDLREEELCPQ